MDFAVITNAVIKRVLCTLSQIDVKHILHLITLNTQIQIDFPFSHISTIHPEEREKENQGCGWFLQLHRPI